MPEPAGPTSEPARPPILAQGPPQPAADWPGRRRTRGRPHGHADHPRRGPARRQRPRPRCARRRQPHAGPRPLLRALLEPRRRPSPLRHRRPGLPRLRQRDRGERPGPPQPADHRGHPCPGRPPHRSHGGDGLRRAHGPPGARAGRHPPRAARLDLLHELRVGGDRGGPEAGPPRDRPPRDHRLPRWLPRPDARRCVDHQLQHQLPARLRAAPPASTSRRSRRSYRDSGATRIGGRGRLPDPPRSPPLDDPPRRWPRSSSSRAGRRRLHPRSAGLPPDPAAGLRPARHPAGRRRGPGGLRADGQDVVVRARRDRARHRLHGQGHRQRPAALRAGQLEVPPGALGKERPRHDLRGTR